MTARWLRRLAVATAFATVALLTGVPSAREGALVTAPPPTPAQPVQQYGPNPAHRLTPQIHRIIRVAQRNKSEENKSRATGGGTGGTQFKKTAPVKKKTVPVKKQTAPVFKKKTAPVKKQTAPVFKKKVAPAKKKTAPVSKKKTAPIKKRVAPVKTDPAPALKKETAPPPKMEVPPVTKEVAPAGTTVPGAPPTEQQQENIEFCAKNPNDPSCSKDAPPPAPEEEPVAEEKIPSATEKICAANPKYPGCDKLGQPSLGPAPEDAGKIGGICEQNPQLSQCQQGQAPEEAVEGPPQAPDVDDGAPPGFIPPGAPAPVPPSPPPFPPTNEGEETTIGPTGPTIQTVPECPDGILHEGQCVVQCPEGMFNQVDENHALQACVAECPESHLIEFNRCVPQCGAGYNVQHEGECFTWCPDDLIALDGQCVASCPSGQIINQNPRQCVTSCPTGLVELDGLCVAVSEQGCLGDQVLDANGQCIAYLGCYQGGRVPHEGACRDECPGSLVQLGSQCAEECPEAWFEEANQCLTYCPAGSQETDWFCRDCPDGTVYGGGRQCHEECGADEVYHENAGQCGASCNPETEIFIDNACVARTAIGYEDFVSMCADQAEGGDTSQLPPEFAGLTPEQMCQLALDQSCQQGGGGYFGNPAESAACRERPCGANQVNTDGICSCAEGSVPFGENQCVQQCPAGQVISSAGACTAPPADDETDVADGPTDGEAPPPADGEAPVNGEAPPENHVEPPDGGAPPQDGAAPPEDETPVVGQPPHSGCPEGTYVLENAQNGGCMQQCPPGTVGNDSGYCAAEVPDDPQPPVTGEAPPATGEPPASGEPPAPTPTAPVSGKPEAPPVKPKKPTLAELTKDAPIPLRLPLGEPVAVVIAVGDYENGAIPAVPQAIGNAAHVVRFLKDDLGLDDPRIITGRNTTLADVEEIFGRPGDTKGELRDLLQKEKPSEVIVYVSGRARTADGGKDVLLLPADADPAKPETGVLLSGLYDNLAAMGVQRLRLYLDPAFVADGEVLRVQAGPVIGPAGILTPRGWVALSGASDNAAVDGDPKRRRGLFAESLVAGLRGIADTTGGGDGDGTITAEELYTFTRDQVAVAAKRGDKQPMPSLYGPPDAALRAY